MRKRSVFAGVQFCFPPLPAPPAILASMLVGHHSPAVSSRSGGFPYPRRSPAPPIAPPRANPSAAHAYRRRRRTRPGAPSHAAPRPLTRHGRPYRRRSGPATRRPTCCAPPTSTTPRFRGSRLAPASRPVGTIGPSSPTTPRDLEPSSLPRPASASSTPTGGKGGGEVK